MDAMGKDRGKGHDQGQTMPRSGLLNADYHAIISQLFQHSVSSESATA